MILTTTSLPAAIREAPLGDILIVKTEATKELAECAAKRMGRGDLLFEVQTSLDQE